MNKEEYKKEIVRMWDSVRGCSKGLDKCHGVDCKECPIHGFKYGCSSPLSAFEIYEAVEKWSKEHQPKKFKISRFEFEILKYLSDNTTFTYITRDGTGWIYLYDEKPEKSVNWWEGKGVNGFVMFNKLFQFIQWHDKEPTSIQDVLKNCEVVEDD